jgi:hypothetical protein
MEIRIQSRKNRISGELEFDITFVAGIYDMTEHALHNAQILAYYAKTGEMVTSLIGK